MKLGSSQARPDWTIGELAARAKVSASAVRYYERRGLMPAPRRRHNWRRYDREALAHLRLIVRARSSGYSLREIAELLATAGTTDASQGARRALIAAKQTALRGELARIQNQLAELERAGACGCRTASDCVLLAE